MRLLFVPAALILLATPALAQHDAHHGSGSKSTTKEHYTGWKELDAYHDVMAQVWHPAKESKNMAPARAHAAMLVERGAAWEASAIPAACAKEGQREAIAAVARDSRAFADLTKSGTDEQLFVAIRDLHDAFEKVNRGCRIPTTK